MEKLIVKNFGPIKEAEIELTKYVVFIGDTSTGKSVLAKLIAIFRDFSNLLKNEVENFDYDKELNFSNQLRNYNIDFKYENTVIEYLDKDLKVVFKDKKIKSIEDKIEKTKSNLIFRDITNLNEDDLKKAFGMVGVRNKIIYFPPERILTSLVGSSISGLWANNVALPICFKNFAANYELARIEKENILFGNFGFSYSYIDNQEFVYNSNGEFKLSQASSGIQSLLPLLLVFNNELNEVFKPNLTFLVEEPELNLFPIKQKLLTDYMIQRINNTNHRLIITTHSPYILSSLDTLILAKNTFNENQDLKDKISDIVHESRWIDYDDIAVYEVRNDGKVYSIKNEEFKSIDSNAIDSVSDIISNEFDKLTELRYARKF
ncbi:AAA family ATPase [Flavobacterium sp.]|jgi:predicted ATPase|uniref:AAA family ATPase n=1 Tax=Flavobacterium sp. TaxID=239 RepID=UPI0037BFB9B3